MTEYLVEHRNFADGIVTGQYVPENVTWSMRRSQPGEVTYEIPLSEPNMRSPSGGLVPEFGPYRTHWYLFRTGSAGNQSLLDAGLVTSVNLNTDRDSILVAGKNWLHYLQRRVFPFDPITYQENDWPNWPKGWPNEDAAGLKEIQGDPVDVVTIVEGLLEAMQSATLPPIPFVPVDGEGENVGQLSITWNNIPGGLTAKLSILPGDSTTIYDHITRLSEMVGGFDFEITPGNREFKMYFPYRDIGIPVYSFRVSNAPETEGEIFGAVTEVDWTNDGPTGTFLWGKGVANQTGGAVWYYRRAIEAFSWLDTPYDFGELPNTDVIFQLLKDQNDLYPQEKLSLKILNPGFMPFNFFGSDRPRSLLGNRVNFRHAWSPYRTVNMDCLVNAITCTTDQSTNEIVELELEHIPESDFPLY